MEAWPLYSPVMATGDPVDAESVSVLSGPGCGKFIRRGLCSSHIQASIFIQI